MGGALIGGLVTSNAAPAANIICSDIRPDALKKLRDQYAVGITSDNRVLCEASEIIIYAVKPQILTHVLDATTEFLDMRKLVVSVAAGVPMVAIESHLGKELRLIRAMPNIAAAVQTSATAIAAGPHALEGDIELAKAIFDSVGETIFIPENVLMDAITGLSGSGPAYIFVIVDAMADAGVKMGLARHEAQLLAIQTVLGAAKLLKETGIHPGQLKDMVTSPGGTAIAGIHTLEKGGLRTTLINAVEAATERSRELGKIIIREFSDTNSKPKV
jgi:pyrroline-5-carboxylate reductase